MVGSRWRKTAMLELNKQTTTTKPTKKTKPKQHHQKIQSMFHRDPLEVKFFRSRTGPGPQLRVHLVHYRHFLSLTVHVGSSGTRVFRTRVWFRSPRPTTVFHSDCTRQVNHFALQQPHCSNVTQVILDFLYIIVTKGDGRTSLGKNQNQPWA